MEILHSEESSQCICWQSLHMAQSDVSSAMETEQGTLVLKLPGHQISSVTLLATSSQRREGSVQISVCSSPLSPRGMI